MFTNLVKIPWLRLKYRFFPSEENAFWAQELLDSQGLSAKLGQVLAQGKSTRLPKASLSPIEMKSLFQSQFNVPISVTSQAFAASMGQVFFAQIEGEEFAVKVLHPGIKDKLKAEIKNVLLLGSYFAKAKKFTFNKDVFQSFLENVFEEETNLTREAHFQEQFRESVQSLPECRVPGVIRKYSNEHVLTQELVRSTLARDMTTFPHHQVFHFFFKSLFENNLLHGDLNDRNWGICEDGSVVVYDFGCSQLISDRRITGLIKLLLNQDIVAGFQEFGVRLEATPFKGKEQLLRDELFNPLLAQDILPSLKYSEELQKKFGDDIKALREFTDPWVLLFMRSLFSLIRIYQDRGVAIPLSRIVTPYLKLPEKSMSATQIKIEVLEEKNLVVSMTLPMTSLDNLEGLMPENVSTKLKEENIKVSELVAKARASQLAAQDLFHLSIGNRSYRVWIE